MTVTQHNQCVWAGLLALSSSVCWWWSGDSGPIEGLGAHRLGRPRSGATWQPWTMLLWHALDNSIGGKSVRKLHQNKRPCCQYWPYFSSWESTLLVTSFSVCMTWQVCKILFWVLACAYWTQAPPEDWWLACSAHQALLHTEHCQLQLELSTSLAQGKKMSWQRLTSACLCCIHWLRSVLCVLYTLCLNLHRSAKRMLYKGRVEVVLSTVAVGTCSPLVVSTHRKCACQSEICSWLSVLSLS